MNTGASGPPARPKTRQAGNSGAAFFASSTKSACWAMVDSVMRSAGVNRLPNVASISAARVVALSESPPSSKKSSETPTTSMPKTSCQIAESLRSTSVSGCRHTLPKGRDRRGESSPRPGQNPHADPPCPQFGSAQPRVPPDLWPLSGHQTVNVVDWARRSWLFLGFCATSVASWQHGKSLHFREIQATNRVRLVSAHHRHASRLLGNAQLRAVGAPARSPYPRRSWRPTTQAPDVPVGSSRQVPRQRSTA